MTELGEEFLGNEDGVPNWTLHSSSTDDDLPWWVPDAYDREITFACQECGSDTTAAEILTPGGSHTETDERICRDC